MSEPLSNVNTPLSYKLGIYRKEAHDPRLCIPEDWKGYNKCVRDLDQLSPDVHKLIEIINSRKTWDATPKAYINKMPFFEEDTDLAQEIINKMNLWLVRRVNEKN